MIPELRARGIGEILDTAVGLYRSTFVRIITLSALVIVPLQVVVTLINLSAQSDSGTTINFGGTSTTDTNARDALVRLAAGLVVLFLGFLANAFVVGLCTRPLADAYIRGPEDAPDGKSPVAHGRVLLMVLATATLVGLCNVLGTFACFIGVVFPLTLFAVAVPVVVLEATRPARALGRSFELTKSHFFHVLGLVVSAQLLGSIINLALSGAIGAWILGGSSDTQLAIARGLAGIISSLLTLPFVTAATVALYFDLRIRNEGFDVQLLIQRNDERHERGTRRGSCPDVVILAQAIDPNDARHAAEGILRDGRFHHNATPRPLRGPLEWLGDRLHPIGDWLGRVLGAVPGWVWIGAAATVLALVIARIAINSRRRRVSGAADGAWSSGAGDEVESADALERAADAAERDGALEQALRLRFRAGLIRLGDRGAIEYRRSVTTSEVRHALGSAVFEDLAGTFEEVAYGGREAAPADLEAARREWPRVLEESAAR